MPEDDRTDCTAYSRVAPNPLANRNFLIQTMTDPYGLNAKFSYSDDISDLHDGNRLI